MRELLERYQEDHGEKEVKSLVNASDAAGWTPLMKAASRGSPVMVADLLLAGAQKANMGTVGGQGKYKPKTALEIAEGRRGGNPYIIRT